MEDDKILYPKLSYQIVGILFDVHNNLGGGLKEKVYYTAIKNAFDNADVIYKEQLMIPLIYNGQKVGSHFLDFLVEDKIVLEIKIGERFRKEYIEQVYSYLKSSNLKLGILANFTKSSLQFKRILNQY